MLARSAGRAALRADPAGRGTDLRRGAHHGGGADAACQERSEVDSVIDDAVITAADAWIRRDEQRLLELAQRQERALRAANELLGGEG